MDVMVVGDHALALEAVRNRIDAVSGVRVVDQASWSSTPGPTPHSGVDLVLLEQTLDTVSAERIASLAAAFDGTPMASVALQSDGRYRWLRFRTLGSAFQVQAVGNGSIEELLRLEAAERESLPRAVVLAG